MTVSDGKQVTSSMPISISEFEELYPRLRRFAAVVVDTDCEPDDIVQDALVDYLRRFKGSDGATKPEAYLKAAILGLARRHRRTAARRKRPGVGSHSETVDIQRYPSDVDWILADVDPTDRALLVLVELEGLPIREAAESVNLTAVAARARLSRVRRRLRRATTQPGA